METIWLIKGRFIKYLRVRTRMRFTSPTLGVSDIGTRGWATAVHLSALRRWEAPAHAARPPPPGAEPQLHPGASRSVRPSAPRAAYGPCPSPLSLGSGRLLPPAALGQSAERARLAVQSPQPRARLAAPTGCYPRPRGSRSAGLGLGVAGDAGCRPGGQAQRQQDQRAGPTPALA